MADEQKRRAVPLPRRAPLAGDPRPRPGAVAHGEFTGTRALSEAVVDCAFYEDGCRRGGQLSVEDAMREVESRQDGFVWIGLHDPAPGVVEKLGRQFALPPLAVEDAIHAHQRPKLEVAEDQLTMVFKTARYVDAQELVEVGELMLFFGPGFVITVRHGAASPLAGIREALEEHPDLLDLGPSAVLYAVADRIVDDYAVVLEGLEIDIEQIEDEVFSGELRNPAERIYRLKREVLQFKRAIGPLAGPLERLTAGTGPVDPRAGEYFADVHDHLLRDTEQLQGFSELLTNVLNANIAQLSVRDNEDMRKISAWLAVIAVPTMVFGLYGMNFEAMPELGWELGFPVVMLITLAVCGALYGRFRRAGWL